MDKRKRVKSSQLSYVAGWIPKDIKENNRVKTIKPIVVLHGTNDPDTINQAKEQIRQGN
jgi:hypothetical protein